MDAISTAAVVGGPVETARVDANPTRVPTVVGETPTAPGLHTAGTPIPATGALPCSPLQDHPLDELPEIISDPYRPPPPGREERHQGVDFSYYRRGERLSIQGVPVQAVLPGTAVLVQAELFPYGNLVIVETPRSALPGPLVGRIGMAEGESVFTLYAHMESAPLVLAGDAITACQALGAVGKSGNAGIAHLHLEMRLGPAGGRLEPMRYYDLHATEVEKASYLRWRISGEFRHFDPMLVLFSAQD